MTVRMELASTWHGRLRGLLGRGKKQGVIVLAPCKGIHTFGMRYCIDVAFIDRHGRVLGSVRALKPGKTMRCPRAYAAIERAAVPNGKWLAPGDLVGMGVIARPDGKRSERKRQ